MRRSLIYDALILALANVFWGSTDVVAKFALEDMSPGALMWSRFTVAFLAFLPVLVIGRSGIPKTLKGLMPFFALGVCGFVLNYALVYHGLEMAPASHATALRVNEALAIVFLSAVILRERIGKWAVVGLVTGMAGVIMVLDVDFSNLGLFTTGSRLGDLLIISGIVVEGLYTIIGKKVLSNTGPLMATALACTAGWIMLTVIYGYDVSREFTAKAPSAGAVAACVYLGLVATVLGYWMYYRVLSRRASHRVGISIMIQPVAGIPIAAVVFHEKLTPGFIVGALLIAAGVYLAVGMNAEKAAGNG